MITRFENNSMSYSCTIKTGDVCLPKISTGLDYTHCVYAPCKPTLVKLVNSAPYTIAFWSDNTQTRATCLPEDIYLPARGLFICRMKKKYGSWTVYELVKQEKQEDKMMRKLLRKVARKIELDNALVINIHN